MKKQLLFTLSLGLFISQFSSAQSWMQQGADINGDAANDNLGKSVSLSADGKIIATGAPGANTLTGLVKIFEKSGSSWIQKGTSINGEASGDSFGFAVSLDSIGNTLAVGSPYNEAGFGASSNSGMVKIYTWSVTAWVQKGANINAEATGDNCGTTVSLSNDGNTVAIGGPSNAGGGNLRGHVRVYNWSGSAWVQKGIDLDGDADFDNLGTSVSLDRTGNYLAIGAPANSGGASGAGQVKVYTYSVSAWVQVGADIYGNASTDWFGQAVSLSNNGMTVAAGAPQDISGGYGYAKIYNWNGSAWLQKGTTLTSSFDTDGYGSAISLSGDGDYLAVGAASGATGNEPGRANIYNWNSTAWEQIGDSIRGEADNDASGSSVSLSDSGKYVAIGAPANNSGAGHVRTYWYGSCIPTASSFTVNTCGSYAWNTVTYTVSGTYNATITNGAGCDSAMTLNLTIQPTSYENLTAVGCKSYTSPSGKIWTTTGIYSDTLDYVSGTCDSVTYSIDLTITVPNIDGLILTTNTLAPVYIGAVANGDVNNDGTQDILLTGINTTGNLIAKIYTNDGAGNFIELGGTSLIAAKFGSVSLVDIDADNLPEVYITGIDSAETSTLGNLYKNNGGGSFTLVTAAPFNTLKGTKHVFADVDNNSTQDLLISSGDSILLYKNTAGTFTSIPIVITNSNANFGFILTGDINGDTFLDIIKSGSDLLTGALPTELLLNDGSGNAFTKTTDSFDDLSFSSGALADINGDNKLDIIIGGLASGFQARLNTYTNDGAGNFTLMNNTELENLFYGSIASEDMDADGDKDLFLTGTADFSNPKTILCLNDGSGHFDKAPSLVVENLQASAAVLFDMDMNGTKDLLITGQDNVQRPSSKLYKNKGCFAPCATKSEMTLNECYGYTSPSGIYTWTETGTYTDTLTNASGCDSIITIHLQVNNSFSSIAVVACDSFISPGGKIHYVSGTHTDTLVAANQWGCDSIITINLNISSGEKISSPSFDLVNNLPFLGAYDCTSVIADVDNDNLPDVLISGRNNSVGTFTRLYKNNGDNNFTLVSGTPFEGTVAGQLAVTDVDGDNKPDVLIIGYSDNSQRIAKLYKNNGANNFTLVSGTPFEGVSESSLAVTDVDGDNKPDVLIVGFSNSFQTVAKLYKNNGANNFTLVSGTPFEKSSHGSLAVTDVDGDNKPDVLIIGYNNDNSQTIAKLYKNNGANNFTLVTGTPFEGTTDGSLTVTDVDGDNKPDVLIVGISNNYQKVAKLYKNNGANNFTLVSGTPFEATTDGSFAATDIDGDNKPDVLINGYGNNGQRIAKLYKNNGDNNFTLVSGTPFEGTINGSLTVADADGDNKPEVLMVGLTGGNGNSATFWFYKNISMQFTGACIAPVGCKTYSSPSGKIWNTSGEYKDTIKVGTGITAYDSIITINLLIDSVKSYFTINTNSTGQYAATISNKAKGNNKTYLWNFGDGSTSVAIAPEHTYSSAGTYSICLTVSNGNCSETYCQNLTLTGKTEGSLSIVVIDETEGTNDPTVDIDEASANGSAGFSIYPNPNDGMFTILAGNTANCTIISPMGQVVYSNKVNQGKQEIDLNEYAPGMYFILFEYEGNTLSQRLVITR